MRILRRREPTILAEDVYVRFLLRYHRAEVTLRETFVQLFERVRGRGERDTRVFEALRGTSLSVYPGEVLGLVGTNGSGKTTLLKALGGIITPDAGRLAVRGRVGCLMSFGVGFKQNLSGRENAFINGSLLGMSEREVAARLDEIVSLSELGEFIDAPVRTYSAGMKGRLGFSIAVHIDPDVLLLDEVLTVGDAWFRAKAGSILERFRERGKTVVVASHSMDLIRRSCTRAIWIDAGVVRMSGTPGEVTRAYVQTMRARKAAAEQAA